MARFQCFDGWERIGFARKRNEIAVLIAYNNLQGTEDVLADLVRLMDAFCLVSEVIKLILTLNACMWAM